MDRLALPVGQTDFRAIRENGNYYIDKTGFVSQLVRDGAYSILFTRPRSFGKTTFQSMLRSFFDIREESRDIFTGLAIMHDREVVDKWMNKYPVIYLTFKDIDGLTFESSLRKLMTKVTELFKSYSFIGKTCTDGDQQAFCNLLSGTASANDIRESLYFLGRLLHGYYGKKVIFLLDEYDVPLDKAERNGYYREMLDVIHSMLLSVLKDCPYTEKGILTGCLRISKESLITGLNNLTVYSVTGSAYASAFGFTEDEVMKLLHDADLEDKADIIRQWYGGYSIGNTSIYTPMDVISSVQKLLSDKNAKPENYWTNARSNEAILRLIKMTNAEVGDDYSTLINGGTISRKVVETLTCNDIYSTPGNTWSLFLLKGYLTLAGRYDANEENLLRIPNEEIRMLFISAVNEWFSAKIMKSSRKKLFNVLWTGDAPNLSEIISDYLFSTISYYDCRENYYHDFLARLLSEAGYIVKSNMETGTIMVFDRINRRSVVFKVKRSLSMESMDGDAERALQPVDSRKYGKDFDGYRTLLFYSAAFFGKDVLIKTTPTMEDETRTEEDKAPILHQRLVEAENGEFVGPFKDLDELMRSFNS